MLREGGVFFFSMGFFFLGVGGGGGALNDARQYVK